MSILTKKMSFAVAEAMRGDVRARANGTEGKCKSQLVFPIELDLALCKHVHTHMHPRARGVQCMHGGRTQVVTHTPLSLKSLPKKKNIGF